MIYLDADHLILALAHNIFEHGGLKLHLVVANHLLQLRRAATQPRTLHTNRTPVN